MATPLKTTDPSSHQQPPAVPQLWVGPYEASSTCLIVCGYPLVPRGQQPFGVQKTAFLSTLPHPPLQSSVALWCSLSIEMGRSHVFFKAMCWSSHSEHLGSICSNRYQLDMLPLLPSAGRGLLAAASLAAPLKCLHVLNTPLLSCLLSILSSANTEFYEHITAWFRRL